MTDDDRRVIAAVLNGLPFVTWDRFVEQDDDEYDRLVETYGWIARDDGRSDFVLLRFPLPAQPGYVGYTTSSAVRSEEIGTILYGEGQQSHFGCERVDEHFAGLVDQTTSVTA